MKANLVDKLKNRTIKNVVEASNVLTITFKDGSEITISADGPEGTTLEYKGIFIMKESGKIT